MCGYQTAARVVSWQITEYPVLDDVRRLHARLGSVDPFWIGQRPLVVRLELGTSTAQWSIQDSELGGLAAGTRELDIKLYGRPAVTGLEARHDR